MGEISWTLAIAEKKPSLSDGQSVGDLQELRRDFHRMGLGNCRCKRSVHLDDGNLFSKVTGTHLDVILYQRLRNSLGKCRWLSNASEVWKANGHVGDVLEPCSMFCWDRSKQSKQRWIYSKYIKRYQRAPPTDHCLMALLVLSLGTYPGLKCLMVHLELLAPYWPVGYFGFRA